MQEYTLMSFNVRFQTPDDGEQQFMNRVGFLTDYLKEIQPDAVLVLGENEKSDV